LAFADPILLVRGIGDSRAAIGVDMRSRRVGCRMRWMRLKRKLRELRERKLW
jgi:hypothetical protein